MSAKADLDKVVRTDAATVIGASGAHADTYNNGAIFQIRRSNGTAPVGSTPAVPSGVLSGEALGRYTFGGWGGSSPGAQVNNAAYISATATATWTTSTAPTRLGFFVAPTTSATAVEAIRVDPSRAVNVNRPDYTVAPTAAWLRVGGYDAGVTTSLTDHAGGGTRKMGLVVEGNTESGALPQNLAHFGLTMVAGTAWDTARVVAANLDVRDTTAAGAAAPDVSAVRASAHVYTNTQHEVWAAEASTTLEAASVPTMPAQALKVEFVNNSGATHASGAAYVSGTGSNSIRHLIKLDWQGAGGGPQQFLFCDASQPPSSSLVWYGTILNDARSGTPLLNIDAAGGIESASRILLTDTVGNGYMEFKEQTTSPLAPSGTKGARMFARNSILTPGRSELCVRFATGAIVVLATQPP